MKNRHNQDSLFSIPEYSADDIRKKREQLSKPKIDHFNHWFRTEFIIYLVAVCCTIIYTSPYFLHFLMRDYPVSYWSEQVYSLIPLWIVLASALSLTTAPYNILKLKPSYKDAEFLVRKERCSQQYLHGSLFVKKQINDYCLSVYKSR